jgi:hypothetical protein
MPSAGTTKSGIVSAARQLQTDDQAVGDLGQVLHDTVQLAGAEPMPCRLRVESDRPSMTALPVR